MKNSHDIARNAMTKQGVTSHELMVEMQTQRLCVGHEREVIERFIEGGPLAVGLTVALFGIIGRQNYMPRTIH